MEDQIVQPRDWKLTAQLAGVTFVIVAIALLFSHVDLPTCAFFSSVAAFALGWQGPAIVESFLPQGSQLPRLPQRKDEEELSEKPEAPSAPLTRKLDNAEEEELSAYKKRAAPANFSQVLITFTPSLSSIYLGTLTDGTAIYSDAKGLCHVALGGATGEGKSTLERLLMAQLCAAGASVLLLNPHYTRYDIEHNEDWTPFEPYLLHPPMECRQYEAIEFYLRQVATVLLPKRLDKYAYSQPVGKPYFLVIDELPAIIKKVPSASEYLEAILREGRKVGIFLVTAATDFLVKTIAPQGGGAIRDCYRTAFYVGGDPTTARVLLDVSSSQVQESLLGKGTVMLRSQNCKQASLARVPYVDNQALYDLLGPSTYVPGEEGEDDQDELLLEHLSPRSIDTTTLAPSLAMKTQVEPMAKSVSTTKVLTQSLSTELQMALNVYSSGMSYRDFGRALGVGKDKAGELMRELKERRLIS